MPTFAKNFTDEVRRLARKELRVATQEIQESNRKLKKSNSDLTKRVANLERLIKKAGSAPQKQGSGRAASAELEEIQQGANDDAWYESLGIDFNVLFDQMKGYFVLIMAKFSFFFVQIIEYMVISIFQLCSYLIFFLQIIFAGILIILGPF